MNEIIKVNYDNDRPTVLARICIIFLKLKLLSKIGSQECANMDSVKEWISTRSKMSRFD